MRVSVSPPIGIFNVSDKNFASMRLLLKQVIRCSFTSAVPASGKYCFDNSRYLSSITPVRSLILCIRLATFLWLFFTDDEAWLFSFPPFSADGCPLDEEEEAVEASFSETVNFTACAKGTIS